MNDQWKAFLQGQSAHTDDQGMTRFNAADTAPACRLFDLSHLRLIEVTGDDRIEFLQGQLTNDVRDLGRDRWQMSGYCTPKGRMLANFLLLPHQQGLLLQLPADTLPMVLKRLPMFILMSRVQISDASDRLVQIGIAGDDAEQALQQHFPSLPDQPGRLTSNGQVTLLQMPGETPRFMLIGEVEQIRPLWQALAEIATPSSSDQWALLDIHAGLPQILQATSETFVPQMVNLQLIDGVSFTKGCYTGQEVVARMKYLGKLKRRMYLAHVDGETAPQPGDQLYASDSDSGQGAGKVVNAAAAPEGGFDLLAVMEIASAENGDLHLVDANGPQLQFSELPYPFEQE